MVFRNVFILSALVLSVALLLVGIALPSVNWAWFFMGPLLVVGVHDLFQNKHTLLKI